MRKDNVTPAPLVPDDEQIQLDRDACLAVLSRGQALWDALHLSVNRPMAVMESYRAARAAFVKLRKMKARAKRIRALEEFYDGASTGAVAGPCQYTGGFDAAARGLEQLLHRFAADVPRFVDDGPVDMTLAGTMIGQMRQILTDIWGGSNGMATIVAHIRADARTALAWTPSDPDDRRKRIIDHLRSGNRRLTGEELRAACDLPEGGAGRKILADMSHEGLLTNGTDSRGRGYGLAAWGDPPKLS